MENKQDTEACRLEQLWHSEFGDAYVERNRNAANGRDKFWNDILARYPVGRVLEVGCNIGANLQWISSAVPPRDVYGIDVNERALIQARSDLPGTNLIWSTARDLPFKDGWFDLAFTSGVLIHQPESSLAGVMAEIVRCSQRYVLCLEYFSQETTPLFYRGEQGALFKRDYGQMYLSLFPQLRLVETGFLDHAQGWDDVTWWLLEKSAHTALPKK